MLHYYRCLDCLSSMTHETNTLHESVKCACGGNLEYLGEVTDESRAVTYSELPVCDDRCTSARGPKCVCHCGGINHGSHLTVTVEHDNGAAVVKPCDAKATERGQEFRALRQAVESKLQEHYSIPLAQIANGVWVDYEMWNRIHNVYVTIRAAQNSRMHKTRIAKLTKALGSIK